jgi:AraC-like DNA-binding protein
MTDGRYQRFQTPEIPAAERFEYWRIWFSQAVDSPTALEPIQNPPRQFHASAEVVGVAQVDIVELHCGPAIGNWSREEIEPHNRLRLALLAPAPGATGRWHGREVSLARGSVTLLGRTDGRWFAPAGFRAIQVNVPRPAAPVAERDLDRITNPEQMLRDSTFSLLIRRWLLGAAGQLDAVARADVDELGTLWISLMNMLVRSLTGDDTNGADSAPARRLQLQRYIRTHLADPRLSPTATADALHVSPRTLYAALSPEDEGVAAQIRRQRLERARTMLLDSSESRSIADVGEAVGLPNSAHFSRLFRACYGYSPSELRAAQRSVT